MLVLPPQILIDHRNLVQHSSILFDLIDKALKSPILLYLLKEIRLDEFHLLTLLLKLNLELLVFRFEVSPKVLLTF